ncbi:MAG: aldehyde dehydrogenase family protein, partial [Woeseiaceae bacterium]
MNETKLNIGGRDIEAAKTGDRLNPVTGDIATRFSAASAADASSAAEAAAAAFPDWAGTGPAARRAILEA